MARSLALAAALVGVASAQLIQSSSKTRVNATGAIAVFMITDCPTCTSDRNSIFCTQGANGDYVQNASYRVSISDKIALVGAADGPKYCWSGTFNALVKNQETIKDGWLGTTGVVTAKLSCDPLNLYYRQCIINNQLSITLIVIGAIVWYCCFTCVCFYCGCCKCCNNKDDLSAWGCCNRFCPTAPCADPPEKEEHLPEHLANPESEEENKASLFGSNKKLNAVSKSGLGELKKPVASGAGGDPVVVLPLGPPPSLPPPSVPAADNSTFEAVNPMRKAKRYDDTEV